MKPVEASSRDVQSGAPPLTVVDPIFAWADAATEHLGSRKQRRHALAYVRVLQQGRAENLRRALPPALYRPVRHFIADAEWDGALVVRRCAGLLLPFFPVQRLALSASSIRNRWGFLALSACGPEGTLPLTISVLQPARLMQPRDWEAPSRALLETVPDPLLRSAPLTFGGAAAENARLRAELDDRGVAYLVTVRAGLREAGVARASGRMLTLADWANSVAGFDGTGRVVTEARVERGGTAREERLVVNRRDGRLVSVQLSNLPIQALEELLEGPPLPEPSVRWQFTALRGNTAWQHHLALCAVEHTWALARRLLPAYRQLAEDAARRASPDGPHDAEGRP